MSSALEQRSFGRTGEKVSVIGLGGAALYKHSYEQGVATVKHALDLGVTYFDTSPAYGRAGVDGRWIDRGISQLIMGEGLEGTTPPAARRSGRLRRARQAIVPLTRRRG